MMLSNNCPYKPLADSLFVLFVVFLGLRFNTGGKITHIQIIIVGVVITSEKLSADQFFYWSFVARRTFSPTSRSALMFAFWRRIRTKVPRAVFTSRWWRTIQASRVNRRHPGRIRSTATAATSAG